jgi:hypothetical protein
MGPVRQEKGMESEIVRHLQPEFAPVAVVWSDSIPHEALQFKKGRFGCTLYLFAEASLRGRVAGGSRTSITCNGGRAALGLGVDFDSSEERLDRYAALFSKGLRSAAKQKAYRANMDAAPEAWRSMLEYGERRHCDADLARTWILEELPRYEVPHEYVLFKPLRTTEPEDDIRSVIFPVNPTELAGLVMLAGSVMHGSDPVRVPQGPACTSLGAFAYAEGDSPAPRAVLGMTDIDGREAMRKRFREDILTLTLPVSLFTRMEEEADDCVFQLPSWRALVGKRPNDSEPCDLEA